MPDPSPLHAALPPSPGWHRPGRPSLLRRYGDFEVRVFDRIDDVDADEWDALLAPTDLQATHRFVKVCEEAEVEDAILRHVLVYRGAVLHAVATLSLMRVRLELLSPTPLRGTAARIRRVAPGFLRVPILFCGLPVSFGQSCLRIRPGADVARILHALVDVMERVADALGARMLCFKEFSEAESARLSALNGLGFHRAPSLPACTLPLRWPSFDAYVSAMRSGYRRQLRASLKVRAREALTVRRAVDFGADCAGLHRLYGQVMDRADYQLERLPPAFFDGLNRRMGAASEAILIERAGELVAGAVLLKAPPVVTFLLVGMDYARNRTCHAYFNTVLEVVAEAIRCGASELVLGQTSYGLKQRLGGRTAPLYLYLRHRSPPGNRLLRAASPLLFPALRLPEHRVFRV